MHDYCIRFVGSEFEGWEFARTSQWAQLFDVIVGGGCYDGFPATGISIFNVVASYWGACLPNMMDTMLVRVGLSGMRIIFLVLHMFGRDSLVTTVSI